jgi:hypothetical protein
MISFSDIFVSFESQGNEPVIMGFNAAEIELRGVYVDG